MFVGSLIERARHIQQQAEAAEGSLPSPPPRAESSRPGSSHQASDSGDDAGNKQKKERRKEPYAGPILPDHLRESFRRYKKDGEGGGVGIGGYSVGLGLPGAGVARAGGRRLFR